MQTVNAKNANEHTPPVDLPIALKASSAEVLIPLKQLVASPYNQRKTKRDPATIEALADNILAVNLLQNLVVHPMNVSPKKARTYGVSAGETRRLALLHNVERGHITLDFPVRCVVISEAEAILASASENDLRVPPHPADQFVAYKALADQGRSPDFIAAVFKVSSKTVAGHLKLANVSPKLFDLFANDEMDLEQIKALAITDDHQAQEAAWFGAQHDWHRSPRELRARLKGDKLAFSDRIVRFVTVEAYEAAGGVVERDLFSEHDEGLIVNRDLLMRLFDEKVASHVEAIKAEGWAWVAARPKFDYDDRNQFTELHAEPAPFTADEQVRYDELQKRYAEICDRLDAHECSEEGDEARLTDEEWSMLDHEYNKVDAEITEMEEREGVFTSEQKKISGAIVYVGHNGELDVLRGLVRREDREQARAVMRGSGITIPRSLTTKVKGVHSEKLLLRLTAHRTAAVQSALAMNPHVALAALVHKLAARLILGDHFPSSAVQITAAACKYKLKNAAPELETADTCVGLHEYVQSWRVQFPENRSELFGWLLEQSDERLLKLLTLCTALSVDGVASDEQPHAINAIAGALNLDLAAHWQPTRENYLDHVSKNRIVAIVASVVSPEEGKRLAAMKKADAAAAAQKLLEGRNWLPEFMAATGDDETVEADESASVTTAAQAVADDGADQSCPKAVDFEQAAHDERPVSSAIAASPDAGAPARNDELGHRAPAMVSVAHAA